MYRALRRCVHALLPAISLLGATLAFAASGTIEGVVRDSHAGDPLPGANVMIVKTSLGASTDAYGKYVIQDVPPGSYTLRATYVGYRQKEVSFQMKEGEVIKQDFKLVSVGVEGEEVVVTAQAAGQKEAINQQLASMPITNVVSRARIQELPDVNAAESVSRLPGVSLIRTGGEGSRIVIRGLSPQYNQITIEGVEQPSNVNSANNLFSWNEGGGLNSAATVSILGDRGMDLSMISSSQLGGIEVIKAITPDMDAAVLGGVVNFGMRKAAREDVVEGSPQSWVPKFELASQAGYNNLKGSYSDYRVVGSMEKRFIDQSFGVFVQGSAEQRNLSSNELSVDYSLYDKDHGDGGVPEMNSLSLIDMERTRERIGGTLVLDYQHATGEIGFLNAISRSATTATRNQEDMLWRVPALFFTVEDTDNRLSILTSILSVKQEIAFFHVDFKASHSYSETSNPEDVNLGFWQRGLTGFDNMGNLARLSPVDLAALATPSAPDTYLGTVRVQSEYTEERTVNGQLDLETTVPISNDLSGRLKVGGSLLYRMREYDLNSNWNWDLAENASIENQLVLMYPSWASPRYPRAIGMHPFVNPDADPGSFLDGDYPLTYLLETDLMRPLLPAFLAVNPVTQNWQNRIATFFNDYSGNETKSAGYAMFTLNIGDNIRVLPGVRYQNLTTSYQAWRGRAVPGAIQGSDTTVTVSHGYWLPMLHARYMPLEWFQIHFAYTNTLNYPDYSTVTPRYYIGDRDVYYNNWRINPARSENFDLVLSFHSNELGLLSINGFKKRIADLIFYQKTYVTDLAIYPDLPKLQGQVWNFSTYINNPNPVDVWGIESEWQTNFWYLPKPFDGLVLNVNYTHVFSEASYPRSIITTVYDDEGNMSQTIADTFYTTRLLNQPNDILNLSVGYDYRGFSARLSMLYQDNIFKKQDFWMQNRQNSARFTRWDLSLKQDLPWLGMQLYLFLNNITGQRETDVNQKTLLPATIQLYGMSADLGLRLRL